MSLRHSPIPNPNPNPNHDPNRWVLVAAVLAHVGEGLAAAAMATARGRSRRVVLGWWLQVSVLGFPAFMQLIAQEP